MLTAHVNANSEAHGKGVSVSQSNLCSNILKLCIKGQ